jgi:hypothetical protein
VGQWRNPDLLDLVRIEAFKESISESRSVKLAQNILHSSFTEYNQKEHSQNPKEQSSSLVSMGPVLCQSQGLKWSPSSTVRHVVIKWTTLPKVPPRTELGYNKILGAQGLTRDTQWR